MSPAKQENKNSKGGRDRFAISPRLRLFLSQRLHYLAWKSWKDSSREMDDWQGKNLDGIFREISLYLEREILATLKENKVECQKRIQEAARNLYPEKFLALVESKKGSGQFISMTTLKRRMGHLQNLYSAQSHREDKSFWDNPEEFAEGQEITFSEHNFATRSFLDLILKIALPGCPELEQVRRNGLELQGRKILVRAIPHKGQTMKILAQGHFWALGGIEPREIRSIDKQETQTGTPNTHWWLLNPEFWQKKLIQDPETRQTLEQDFYLRFASGPSILSKVIGNNLAIPPGKTLDQNRFPGDFAGRRLTFIDFLENDEECLVVLGKGGEGKSTWLLWQAWENQEKASFYLILNHFVDSLQEILDHHQNVGSDERIVIIFDEPRLHLSSIDIQNLGNFLSRSHLKLGKELMFVFGEREYVFENWSLKSAFLSLFRRIDIGIYQSGSLSRQYLEKVASALETFSLVSSQKDRLIGLILQRSETFSLVEKALDLIEEIDRDCISKNYRHEWTNWEEEHQGKPLKFLYHHVAFFYQFGIKPSLEVFIGHEAFQSPDPEELYAALEEGNLILLEGSELSLRHPKLAEWYFEQNIMYNRWKISVSDMIGRFFRGFTDHVQGEKLLHTLLEHPEFQEKMNLGYYQKPGSGHITGLTFQNLGTWMDDLIERYADPDPKTLFHAFNCYLKADEHLPPLVLLEEFQQKHQDRIKDPEFLDVMIQCSLMVNNFAKGRELIDLRRSSGVLSPALISLKAKILTAEGEMVKAFSLLIDQLSVGNTDPGLCDLLADLEKEILHWIRTLDPQSENIPNSVKLELATTFLREKRAMNLAKFWIQQMPENAQTLRLLGEWYSVSEKPDQEQAGICFRKALALLPESSEMHVAFLNWCRDRYAETGLIQYFSEANSFFQSIQNQANIPLILIQIMSDLLMVRWKLEGLEASFMEAIEKLNNILRKNPQHTGALLQMGRGLVSKYQHSLTDFDFHKAESFLRELLYRSDTKNDAFASMAELYQCKWAQDRNPTYLVTARAFLQEAIEANPWEKEPRILMLNLLELDQGQEIAANYAWDCFLHLPGEIEFLKYWWDSYQNQKPRSPFIELKKLLQMSLHPEDCFGTLRKFLWDEKRLCHLFLALCEDFYEQNPQEPTYFSEQARVVLDLKSHAMAENLCVKIQEFLGQYPLHPAATKLQNEITRLQLSLLEEERILNCFFLANLNGEGALTMNPTGDPLFPEQGNSEALSRPGQYYYARLSGGKNQIGTYFERNFHRDFY